MKLWSTLTAALAGVTAMAIGLTAYGASAPIQNSKHNIALYNKAGYEHQFDQVAGDLTYAYLRKVLEAGAIIDDEDDVAVRGDN